MSEYAIKAMGMVNTGDKHLPQMGNMFGLKIGRFDGTVHTAVGSLPTQHLPTALEQQRAGAQPGNDPNKIVDGHIRSSGERGPAQLPPVETINANVAKAVMSQTPATTQGKSALDVRARQGGQLDATGNHVSVFEQRMKTINAVVALANTARPPVSNRGLSAVLPAEEIAPMKPVETTHMPTVMAAYQTHAQAALGIKAA